MIHNLETMVLLYLLLGATAAADSGGGGGGGIQTNQMDLLSGIPALLVVFVGIVQIWPSPAQMCRPGLYAFLNWLKDSVENDFYISIHSCDKRCQTQLFEPTLGSINRRICINVGDAQETGCIDSGYVSVDELIDIIQADGNSVTLAELAMTARYPQIKQLSRIITVLRFSPTLGRRVIIFQWLAVSVMYVLSWLFSGWLFLGIKRLLRGLWNDVRRVFGLLPVDYAQYRRFGLGYHIAELAEHRLVFEHLPWVRYSVYYLLLKLAGRKLSIRAWGIEDKKTIYKKNNDTIGINRGSENSPVFEHPMVDQRRLAALIATDKCSAALLLFAISLHSLRVMMLCRSIGFLPAHIITGSFSNVFLKLEHTIIAFVCPRLETVYKTMYVYQGYNKNNTEIGPEIRDYLHLSYSLLLKKLQSPLGDQITGQQQINILINLALRDIDTAYVDWARHKIPRNPDSPQPDIEGIIISDKQLNKLCRGHMNVLLNIHTLLESFLVSNIYWGVSVWLLRTLLIVCKDLSLIEPDSSVTGTVQGAGRSGGTSEIIEMLYLLVNSPFSIHPYEQIENGNAADTWVEPKVPKISIKSLKPKPGENILVTKRGELLWMIGDIISFDYDECFTAPMWCVCRGHCRGICTLIVNELDMYLSIRNYFSTPYSFMMDTVEEKSSSEDSPPEQQQQKQQQQEQQQQEQQQQEQQQQEQQAHIAQAQSTPEQTPPPPSLTQSAPTQPFSIHSAPVRPDSVHSAPARLGPICSISEQSDIIRSASPQPVPANVEPAQPDQTQPVTADTSHYYTTLDRDKKVQAAPKLKIRPVTKNQPDDATEQSSEPATVSKNVFRLVCISNRHMLFRLVEDGAVIWKRNTPKTTEMSNEKIVDDPKKSVYSIVRWWQSINIRHRLEQRTPRIDYTYYPLSHHLYENTAQLVIILGDQIYTVHSPASSSTNTVTENSAETLKELWPFTGFVKKFSSCLNEDPHEVVRRVLPLRLPSVDKFSQQITKEVAMSEGWLQRDRRQRRKDRYTLVSPSGNIRVETDAAEPQ